MIQMYGHKFTSAWGTEDLGVWQKIIFSFSTYVVKQALDFLITQDHEFMDFPPNPMQFRKICDRIKKENAPRPQNNLTAPCDVCGKPGREINLPDQKKTKIFCFDDYMQFKDIKPISHEAIAKQFPTDESVSPAIRNYNQMRLQSMQDGWHELRRKFENE